MNRIKVHHLEDIIFIAIASVICGAEGWNDMESFGNSKEEWLVHFFAYPRVSLSMILSTMFSPLLIFMNWKNHSCHGPVLWLNWQKNEVVCIDEVCVIPVAMALKASSTWSAHVSNLRPDVELMNKSVHSHWAIENSLHWVLDVAFNEDHNRKRSGNAAQNFSVINRIALNLLKNEKSAKVWVKGKD